MSYHKLTVAALALVATTAQAEDSVRLVVLPYLSQAPLFIGIAEGLFEKEGISIERIDLKSSAPVVPGIMSGEFDAAMAVPSAAYYNAIRNGGQGRVVGPGILFSTEACDYAVYYGRQGFDNAAFTSGTELHVKLSADPLTFEGYLSETLLTLPGSEKLNFEYLEMPAYVQGQALKTKAIDVAFTTEPWATRFDLEGLGQVAMGASAILPNAQYGTTMFSARLTSEQPDLGRRMKHALDAAIVKYNEGKTDRNVEIISEYTGLEAELVRKACWAYVPADGVVRKDSMMDYQEWLLGKGIVASVLPEEEIVTSLDPE